MNVCCRWWCWPSGAIFAGVLRRAAGSNRMVERQFHRPNYPVNLGEMAEEAIPGRPTGIAGAAIEAHVHHWMMFISGIESPSGLGIAVRPPTSTGSTAPPPTRSRSSTAGVVTKLLANKYYIDEI